MTRILGMLPHFSATWPSGLMLRPYSLGQMPWLLFIPPCNFVQLLFKSSYYLRVAFIKLGMKMKKSTASRKVEWLQTPVSQSIILCFLQSLNCNWCMLSACFDNCHRVMNTCASATRILAVASIRERWLFHAAHPEVQRQFQSVN